MKTADLIALALAGIAFYFIVTKKPADAAVMRAGSTTPRVDEILNTALPGQPGWGWKYYSDGTAIGPDGRYYSGGQYIPGT